jgi:hypothetical protein
MDLCLSAERKNKEVERNTDHMKIKTWLLGHMVGKVSPLEGLRRTAAGRR